MSTPQERALQRANMQVRLVPSGQEGTDDLSATTTIAERIAMMRPLALAAWSVAGLPLPEYSRDEMPMKLVRRRAKDLADVAMLGPDDADGA